MYGFVHEMGRRLLVFTWNVGGGASCRGCSSDNLDKRRNIRNLISVEECISKTDTSRFVNEELEVDVPYIVKRGH